jgi:integrase
MSRAGSVYKDPKSGLWGVKVDVAPRGAKRRQVHKRGYRTRREAQDALVEVLGNVSKGTHVNPSTITFREWAEEWLPGLPATGLRPRTVDFYRDMIDLAVGHLGDARLQSLLPADLNRCYAALLAESPRGTKRGLSPATVGKVHVAIGKCLGDAVKQGLLARNVAELASPPSASSTRAPETQVWTPAETAEFLRFVEARGDRNATLYRLAAMSGLRRGELCGLKWDDLEGSRLSVRRQVTVSNGQEPYVGEVKTARARRNIDLDDETVAKLRVHRRAQTEERLALGLGGRFEFVFAEPDGSLLDPRNVTARFNQAVKDSGMKRVRFHDLRHGHATHLLRAGQSAKLVADRLGHASASFSLDKYAHVIAGMGADAAAAVAALVDGERI